MLRDDAADDLVEIVVDEYSNAILTAASAKPVTVDEITNAVSMSSATAYRRINDLLTYDLLDEQTWIDETGTQCHVYEANFETLKIEIVDGIAYLHIVQETNHNLARIWEYR
ncbi:DNA-binding protein [Halorhabdus amylolytica]|uniref:DNA-binding protein n=1 Tax=Halorhabdus amylolytica TaxID=2559573 RepID=UPI0010AA7FAC|nr:DNA-binding protein [Halorhabdus amylolytica]